ncbi:neisseria PilC beta-propeller domain protein [Collimonas arenae]|uniref:Neisseria PilC beta-propeller domain protein n=1 Tax=Collimonas arenae TaxID=279058 RepID=A0A127QQ63_9BURK|nr:PilC/PilY family type IV pilus protein [Collimonas arenae]AMP02384.1 neisseria PilC beta-propeller domain protein [Collimonas arenae]AMP12280.1 neisseria PilC beta-propeller domain protein [Collimonas arenae]
MKAQLHCVIGIIVSLCAAVVHAGSPPHQPPFIYTASYESDSWLGHLKAFPMTDDGVSGVAQWDAADLIPPWSQRRIFAAGAAFQWQQLDDVQRAMLLSEPVVQYLAGDDALEVAHGIGRFRNRNGKLGDIMHSLPLYVGPSDSVYHLIPQAAGGGTYKEFVGNKRQRRAMLYVGANDGMLHAFDAVTGVETMAFVPSVVFPYLHELSDVAYRHRSFVDGLLTAGDAYLTHGGKTGWRTILLGSTGKGAKSLFALDISDPERLDGSSVLWQRSADDDGFGAADDDMGYLQGEVFAVRLRHGGWSALYGNGDDSSERRAVLYLADLANGSLICKLYAGVRDAALPNGLSTPALEFNPQREIVAAYAGDLLGHLWKFDLDHVEPENWGVAFDGAPLFAATDDLGQRQSVTQQPLLALHPKGGKIVMFSGGASTDIVGPDVKRVQTLYGVREKIGAEPISGRAQLQQQTLTATGDGRWTLSRNPIDWSRQRGWYVDLPEQVGQVVGKLQIADGVLWVLTFSAEHQKSHLLALDYTIGGATVGTAQATFLQKTSMIEAVASTTTPTFIRLPDGRRRFVVIDRNGVPRAIELDTARGPVFRTWRQLPVPPGLSD